MPKPNGFIIYRGPSMLDGAPIVVIATGFAQATENEKTGAALIQTWVLRGDVSPTAAVKTGEDAAICGACPHRGRVVNGVHGVGRSCYVTVFHAPLVVYKAFKRGIYPVAEDLAALFAGRGVRLGSYGDPAAVPMPVWDAALSRATFHTGYTHQWRTAEPGFARYVMASCDSAVDRFLAKAMGYRTFRVTAGLEPKLAKEITCPASAEAGYKTTCSDCRACGGTSAKARADVVIAAHGAAGVVKNAAIKIATERERLSCSIENRLVVLRWLTLPFSKPTASLSA